MYFDQPAKLSSVEINRFCGEQAVRRNLCRKAATAAHVISLRRRHDHVAVLVNLQGRWEFSHQLCHLRYIAAVQSERVAKIDDSLRTVTGAFFVCS